MASSSKVATFDCINNGPSRRDTQMRAAVIAENSSRLCGADNLDFTPTELPERRFATFLEKDRALAATRQVRHL